MSVLTCFSTIPWSLVTPAPCWRSGLIQNRDSLGARLPLPFSCTYADSTFGTVVHIDDAYAIRGCVSPRQDQVTIEPAAGHRNGSCFPNLRRKGHPSMNTRYFCHPSY